jgi:hypothetical protein
LSRRSSHPSSAIDLPPPDLLMSDQFLRLVSRSTKFDKQANTSHTQLDFFSPQVSSAQHDNDDAAAPTPYHALEAARAASQSTVTTWRRNRPPQLIRSGLVDLVMIFDSLRCRFGVRGLATIEVRRHSIRLVCCRADRTFRETRTWRPSMHHMCAMRLLMPTIVFLLLVVMCRGQKSAGQAAPISAAKTAAALDFFGTGAAASPASAASSTSNGKGTKRVREEEAEEDEDADADADGSDADANEDDEQEDVNEDDMQDDGGNDLDDDDEGDGEEGVQLFNRRASSATDAADGDEEGAEDIASTAAKRLKEFRRNAGIHVQGSDIPPPFARFEDLRHKRFAVPEYIVANLSRAVGEEGCGYSNPTPIQQQAIPILLKGRELLACAPTGSGKVSDSHACNSHELVAFARMPTHMHRVLLVPADRRIRRADRECTEAAREDWISCFDPRSHARIS